MKSFKSTFFLLVVYFLTISFHNNVESSVNQIELTDTCQLSAEIDGKKIAIIEGIGKIRNGSNVIKYFKKPPDSSSFIFQSYLFKYPAGLSDISINLGTLKFSGLKIADSLFTDFIQLKKYDFSKYAENGVEIIYHDKKSNQWTTRQGSQDNSSFEITEIKADSLSIKFKAIFNCKLFNSEGKEKILENGIYIGYFKNK